MDGLDAELARVASVLLDNRVVRRVIKQHRRLPGIGLQVPHAGCYWLPRSELVRLVERDELDGDLAALPAQVTIVSGPREALTAGDPDALVRVWRAVFHARVHQVFEQRIASGALTPAAIRERIHRVGETEFDEARRVLREEDLVLPPADDTSTYVEFAALYLELRHFAPRALGRTFPTLELAHVDAALALDVDHAALLAASRPARAPEQPWSGDTAAHDAGELPRVAAAVALGPRTVDRSARRRASRARVKGNRARAAILALRAGDREAASADLDELCARLARAIGATAPEPSWSAALLPVAELAAAQRVLRFTPGARLLHDLQAACVVAEREVKVVDVIGWLWSRRKQPIVRALPATRAIRVAKRLHAAEAKLASCALRSAGEHARLAQAIRDLVTRADDHVRTSLRPKIVAALDAVALHPRNLPEHVAEKKLVDELLDQAVAVGRLSIGNLRDAISHNDLKLPDFRRHQLRAGDALLRADQALARSLDGVYRRGEGYLRVIHKVSSLLFGTPIGRVLTLYVILPLLGSYTVLEAVQHMASPVAGWLGYQAPAIATRTTMLAGAAALFVLIHVPPLRRALGFLLRWLGRALRLVLLDVPRALLAVPAIRWLAGSWPSRWLVLPALPAALVWLTVRDGLRWPVAGGVLVASAAAINSRIGRRAHEVVTDAVVRWTHHLTGRLVPSVIRWLLGLFSELVELLDRALYRVDEWLRFRTGQSAVTLVVKGGLGIVWSVIAYFLRLYITLFIEPEVNPIKHFPVVTVAAKIMLPFTEPIVSAISGPASRVLGTTLGVPFAAFTMFVLPGLAGFLVWEFKENWKLYRRTRPRTLRAVSFGHHGETMVALLAPGFHSGTIPKQFTKLRRAAWNGDEAAVARHRDELRQIEHAIHTFVDRELVSMLNEAPAFRVTDVAVSRVTIGSNRVQVELICPSVPAAAGEPSERAAARITFEYQAGWMIASLPVRGWIDNLADDQRDILEIALAGFYKRAGVELVREQLEHVVGDNRDTPPYDISDDGLVVWPGHGYQTEAVYNLAASQPTARLRGAPWTGELPALTGRHALFYRTPLSWAAWTAVWEQLARGEPPSPIVAGPGLIGRPLRAGSQGGPGAATPELRTPRISAPESSGIH